MDEHRKNSNIVKSKLLHEFATCDSIILDLACGRGGDLWKWSKIKVKGVVGVDIHGPSIIEARRRYHDNKNRIRLSVYFFHLDALDCENVTKVREGVLGRCVDIVSCHFALHYFCMNTTTLCKVFTTVVSNLKVGGIFYGVCPDGDRLYELLSNNNSIKIEDIEINRCNEGYIFRQINAKGSHSYFEFQGESKEYFAKRQMLTEIGTEFGFECKFIPMEYYLGKSTALCSLYFVFIFTLSNRNVR